MQVLEKKNEGLNRSYEITIPSAQMETERDNKLKEYSGKINLPGFRPGKVPLAILKQRFGKDVMGEVLEQVIENSTKKAFEEKGIKPAIRPDIKIDEYDQGKDLVFNVTLEVLPEFELQDTKGISLEKPVADITDETIIAKIGEWLERMEKSVPCEDKARKVKEGDIVVISFDGRIAESGEKLDGMASDSHKIRIGSHTFIEGFEEQIIGHKAGDKFDVKVTFPEDYGHEKLSGKDAVFETEVLEIHEQLKAEANDEVAKQLGFENKDQMLETFKNIVEREYKEMSDMKLRRALMDVLDEKYSFDIPETLYKKEYESIIGQAKTEQRGGRPAGDGEDDIELDEEDRKDIEKIANRRVRVGLVLAKIGEENKITVSQKEIYDAVVAESKKYPGSEKAVFDFFNNNVQALESIKGTIFESKVVDYLLELAEIKEVKVTAEELADFDEEDEEEAKPKKATSSKSKKEKSESKAKSETKSEAKAETKAKSEDKPKEAAKKKSGKTADKKETKK